MAPIVLFTKKTKTKKRELKDGKKLLVNFTKEQWKSINKKKDEEMSIGQIIRALIDSWLRKEVEVKTIDNALLIRKLKRLSK